MFSPARIGCLLGVWTDGFTKCGYQWIQRITVKKINPCKVVCKMKEYNNLWNIQKG